MVYDAASRVNNLTVNGAAYASSFNYNAASQTTSLNVGGTANQLSESYTYDSLNGLMTNQTVQRTNPGTMLNLSYDYLRAGTTTGKTGQLTKITNILVPSGDKNRIYEYDGTGELKAAKGGATGTLWTQTYSYDRLGNRTSVAATGSPAGGGTMPPDGVPATVNYEQASNRATSIVPNPQYNPPNPNLEYDPAGNQTRTLLSSGTAQRYYYDVAGRLAQIKTDDNATVITTYGYGASNQRLKQTEGGMTLCYAWLGSSIIGQYTDNGSALAWQLAYVYLGGRLLATQIPGSGTNATQFHHKDRLGTRLINNAGDTGYTENMVLPYGTTIAAESMGTPPNTPNNTPNRRFTSYDRSSAVTLDYAVNRFYDCNQGRFTQPDPAGQQAVDQSLPRSQNRYSYTINDPVNLVDQTGLFYGECRDVYWNGLFMGNTCSSGWDAFLIDGPELLQPNDGPQPIEPPVTCKVMLGARKIQGFEGHDYYHLFIVVQQSDGAWNIVHHAFPEGPFYNAGRLIGRTNNWDNGDIDYQLFNQMSVADRNKLSVSIPYPGNCDEFRTIFDAARDAINAKNIPYLYPVYGRPDNTISNSNAYAYTLLKRAGVANLYTTIFSRPSVIAPGWGNNLL